MGLGCIFAEKGEGGGGGRGEGEGSFFHLC